MLGYGRVSREGQDLAQQRAALRAAGCGRLFEEKASGGRWDRPELHRLLDHLRPKFERPLDVRNREASIIAKNWTQPLGR